MRIAVLKNTPHTLLKTFHDSDGTQVDAGDVTVRVEDAAGQEVVAETPATKSGSGAETTYSLDLEAQPDVALLIVTWTSPTHGVREDLVDVVGAHLFTIEEARAATMTGGQTPLNNLPANVLRQWRSYVTGLFEQRTGQSFIPKYGRMKLRGEGTRSLWFPDGIPVTAQGLPLDAGGENRDIRRILSVTINGQAQDVDDFFPARQGIESRFTIPKATSGNPFNVVVEYEYGRLPVAEARENALRMMFANAVASDLPSRATSFNNEDGTFRLTTFPVEVEEFLRSHDRRGVLA